MRAVHHDLCFGCGLANVFGLGIEAQRGEDGTVRGRFFVKQDHQGADGRAHPGILAAALIEALALAGADTSPLSLSVDGTPAVGTFVEVEAGGRRAVLRDDAGTVLASAHSG